MTAIGGKGGILGIGQDVSGGTYGTAESRTVGIEITSDGTGKEQALMEKAGIPSVGIDKDDTAPGRVTAGGDLSFENRYEGDGVIFYNALGSVSSAEVASFTVIDSGDNQNNKIDFKEDGGAELTATLTAGTYAMGATSAVDGSLAKEIKTQLEATGTGTYTVTFDAGTTDKLSIAVSGAVSAVQILTDGTNTGDSAHTLLGFTSNSTSSASVTGDTALTAVYDHTITVSDDVPTGELTMEVDVDETAKLYEGARINTAEIAVENDGFMNTTIGIIAEDQTLSSVTSLTASSSPLVSFDEVAVTYNASTELVNNLTISLNNNLAAERYKLNSRLVKEPIRGGRREVTGSFELDFEDDGSNTNTFFDDFVAAQERALTATATSGTAIKTDADGSTTYDYKYTMTLSNIIPTATTFQPGEVGIIPQSVEFKAFKDGATGEISIVIRNSKNVVTL